MEQGEKEHGRSAQHVTIVKIVFRCINVKVHNASLGAL